jgi:hypothetical protein
MKFCFNLELDLMGCKKSEVVDVDAVELEGMSDDEIDDYVEQELLRDWAYQHIDYWCKRE